MTQNGDSLTCDKDPTVTNYKDKQESTDTNNVVTGETLNDHTDQDPQPETGIGHKKELEIFEENTDDLKNLSKFINQTIDELMSYDN